jgi:hypothetical protein
MATIRRLDRRLAVKIPCSAGTAIGDIVELISDNMVAPISSEASIKIVGEVAAIEEVDGDFYATVQGRFRVYRDDRIAGANDVDAAGPFFFDAAGEIQDWVGAIHASSTGNEDGPFTFDSGVDDVLKLTVNSYGGGTVQTVNLPHATMTTSELVAWLNAPVSLTSTNHDTFTLVLDTSDVFKVTIGNLAAQTIILRAGVARPAADIAAEIEAVAIGFHATTVTVAEEVFIVITAVDRSHSIQIMTDVHDCNAVLGFAEATTAPPVLGIVASVTALNYLKLTAMNKTDHLIVGTDAADANVTLGLTEATTTDTPAPVDAAAIAGMVLAAALNDATCKTLEY